MRIPEGIELVQIENMNPAAARVLIAQDCLRWLEIPAIRPSLVKYLSVSARRDDDKIIHDPVCSISFTSLKRDSAQSAHELLREIPEESFCKVCAIGLITIATISRFSSTVEDLLPEDGLSGFGESLREYLKRFFSAQQLIIMESTYEGWHPGLLLENGEQWASEAYPALVAFFRDYPLPRERLKAIFQNIIDNEGEFILPEVA